MRTSSIENKKYLIKMAFNIRFNLNHAYLQNMNLDNGGGDVEGARDARDAAVGAGQNVNRNLMDDGGFAGAGGAAGGAAVGDNYFVRVSPEVVSQMLPEYNYHQFSNLLQNNPFFPYDVESINFELNVDYYYIIYLICSHRYEEAMNSIININNYIHEYNFGIDNIINFQHAAFNGSTIVHYALQWGASSEFIRWLLEMGGEVNIQNNDGATPGEDIHLTIWIHPFAQYFNMPMVLQEDGGSRRFAMRHRDDFYLDEIINNREM